MRRSRRGPTARSARGAPSLASRPNLGEEARADARGFLEVAPEVPVTTATVPCPLEDANRALEDLREGRLEGAAVLEIG